MKKLLFSLPFFLFYLSSTAIDWETLSFTTARGGVYCASSELNKPSGFFFGKYGPHNLFDRDPATAWVEGEAGSGAGSYVCIGTGRDLPPYIVLANGYQKSHDLFLKNNRIRTLKVTLWLAFTGPRQETQAGFTAEAVDFPGSRTIQLKDEEGYQILKMPFDTAEVRRFRDRLFREYVLSHQDTLLKEKAYSGLKEFFFVKFEITEVYKGSKWDDTCLSDLLFSTRKEIPFIPRNEQILTVLESDNEGSILVRTVSGKVYTLDSISRDAVVNGTVLSVLDVSPDKKWAVIDEMTGGAGRGTEETYKLFYLPLLEEVNVMYLYDEGQALGFEEKNGKLYIQLFDGEEPAEDVEQDVLMMHEFSFIEDGGIEALPVLFADAVNRHDVRAFLSCMDDNYLEEQLVSLHKNDTTTFLKGQFCGEPPSGGSFACLDMNRISVVGEPQTEQVDDGAWQLTLTLTDGKKTVNAVWIIDEREGDGSGSVFGLYGAVG